MTSAHNLRTLSTLPAIIHAVLLLTPRASAACTLPNGQISKDTVRCNPNQTGPSTCCMKDDACFANNLCLEDYNVGPNSTAMNRVYWRGACDGDWGSSGCLQICKSGTPGGSEKVRYCGGGKYCCMADSKRCCDDSSVEKYDLGEPVLYAFAGSGNTTLPIGAGLMASGSITSGLVASVSTISTSSPIMTSPTPTLTTPAASTGSSTSDNSQAVRVGVGVGLTFGLLLIGVTIGGLWWMRRTVKYFEQKELQHKEEQIARDSTPEELSVEQLAVKPELQSVAVQEMEHRHWAPHLELP